MLPTKFRFIWLSSFKGEDFLEIDQSVVAGSGSMFVEFSSDKTITMSGFSAIFADTSGRHSELTPLLVNKD
jgi:hypothetical protein